MKKYKTLLTIGLVLLYLFGLYTSYSLFLKPKKVYLKDLNITIPNIDKKVAISLDDVHHTSFKYWGLKRNKLLDKRESKKNSSIIATVNVKKDIPKYNLKERTICYNEKCWEFMGIITIKGETTVTLLSKEKKRNLETLKVGDELLKGLLVIDIKEDRVVLSSLKKKKKFTLKLFEIDASKYYPKKTKEINE